MWSDVLALADHVGLRMNVIDARVVPSDTYQYDGVTRTVTVPRGNLSHAVHELAHFLVSPPENLAKHNYGFGEGGPAGGKVATGDPNLRGWDGVPAECVASMLGILLERDLGMPHMETFSDHNWKNDYRAVRSYIKDLLRRGHVVWYQGRLRTHVFVDYMRSGGLT